MIYSTVKSFDVAVTSLEISPRYEYVIIWVQDTGEDEY